MADHQGLEIAKWRPHHIYCEQFLATDFPDRGEKFDNVAHKIRETIRSGADIIIEVIEGVDELCRFCPLCKDNRCQSPNGNEDEVRKWDAIILKGLGITYGEKMAAKDFRALIKQKTPLDFCRTRCPWRDSCSVFG
ncbi:MAG: DUF1284 domain-containing protein [Pseudomonadota bacterium]